MKLTLVCLFSLAVVASAQYLGTHLGHPPDPSRPLNIHTVIGSKFLFRRRPYGLSPDQPYRDQARFIGEHGYHSEYLLEELGTGRSHHSHYHR